MEEVDLHKAMCIKVENTMLGEESKVRYTIFINLKHKQFILFVFLDTCLKLKQSYTKVDWVRIHTSFTRVIEG